MLRDAVSEERTTMSTMRIIGFFLLVAAGEALDTEDVDSVAILARTASLTLALFASLGLL